jgi:hypothetical protein
MTYTTPEDLAVEAVRRQAEVDEYGPLFNVEEVTRNPHAEVDEHDRCTLCGHVQIGTRTDAARKAEHEHGTPGWWDAYRDTCFDAGLFTVEFTYNDQGHRALYGVPAEGAPSCWAS